MERVDLAVFSRQLLRQAVWCGLVFSLAALLVVLNALPPVPVKYEITGKILIEPSRVEGLVQNLKQSTDWSEPTVLRDFQVLARSQAEQSPNMTQFHGAERVFLMLSGLWSNQCSISEFAAWADSITQPVAKVNRDSGLASEARLARWELSAAEHYKKHHEFLSNTTMQPESSAFGNALSKSGSNASLETTRFQFAGLESTPASGHLVASLSAADSNAGDSNTRPSANVHSSVAGAEQLPDFVHQKQLEANIAVARQRLELLETNLSQSWERMAGEIEILDVPRIVPISDRIPTWMALSVLVILASTGGLAGAFYFRLQSGGVYDPQEVAQQLASRGLPVVSVVQLPSDQLDSTDWLELAGRQASGAGRKTAKNLTRLSEAVLSIWCAVILARFLFDPMWRIVLVDSPLAAFSRLITGLP